MAKFSYILSPTVNMELPNIEKRRREMLLVLLPPRAEIKLRFENECQVISSSLFLVGKSISAREVGHIISGKTKTKPADVETLKTAHDVLRLNWFLSEKRIDYEMIRSFVKVFSPDLQLKRTDVETILQFIGQGEHPIVQVALSFILFYTILPRNNYSILISNNISKGFAYMHGFDFRGLINFEEYITGDLIKFEDLLKRAVKQDNLSDFIEYFVQIYSLAADKSIQKIRENRLPAAYVPPLTKRQEKILLLFEIPNAKVTNRDVAKEFGISQITSSRDLSTLYSLGLIFKKGKGRSVYYVKV